MVKYWILQANPEGRYRILDALREGYAINSWRVVQLRDEIEPGDEFALWASSRQKEKRGVYALGVVTEPVEYGRRDPDPYWIDPAEAKSPMWRVGIRIDENLINSPIPSDELFNDPRFARALIRRMPGGPNPFPLTKAEWRAIISHRPARTKIRRRKIGSEQPLQYEIAFGGTAVGSTLRIDAGSRSWWAQPLDARPWERFPNRTQAEEYLAAPYNQATAHTGFGKPFQRVNETTASAPKNPFIPDPDLVDRGNQAHAQTLNALADFMDAQGVQPLAPGPNDPLFDLGWIRGEACFIAEVKSLTEANEEHQLRLGLGQVLRYQHALLNRFTSVHAVLVVEREPGDPAWKELCSFRQVRLAWPPEFRTLADDFGLSSQPRRRR